MLEQGQRPPSPARQGARTQQVNVRLTADEKAVLESTAKSRGFKGCFPIFSADRRAEIVVAAAVPKHTQSTGILPSVFCFANEYCIGVTQENCNVQFANKRKGRTSEFRERRPTILGPRSQWWAGGRLGSLVPPYDFAVLLWRYAYQLPLPDNALE